MMGNFRGIIVVLIVLGALWILFLVSAHLILDLEQGKVYLQSLGPFERAKMLKEIEQVKEELLDFGDLDDDNIESETQDEDFTLCEIPEDPSYPNCKNRVEWLRENWGKDPCYKEYDVDGTDCSIIIYMSEVESWCPRLHWREYMTKKERRSEKAALRQSPDELISNLKSIRGCQPIISRILGMWSYWQDGLTFMLNQKQNIHNRKKLRVLVYIGDLVSPEQKDSYPNDDIQQWSDLLASLYLLGHDVSIMADTVELLSLLTEGSKSTQIGCQKGNTEIDLIYIDIPGLQQLVISVPDAGTKSLLWSKYSCRFRVLTPFGMDAEFNYRDFKGSVMGERSQLGNWNLNLKQFMTRYPLSVDNSFLGFTVGSGRKRTLHRKTSTAFVYGEPSQLQASENFLRMVYKQMKIHTSMSIDNTNNTLQFMVNHENLNSSSLRRLLRKSKLFIGLGSPYDAALPLDAIAQGCIFINPKFTEHHSRLNSKALKSQPSSRKFGSQLPYAEIFVGRPWVYTVDINNHTAVKATLAEIARLKVKPYIPFEFSCEGMLERLNSYIENQSFCNKDRHSPPQSDDLEITIGHVGESCIDTCFREGLTCGAEYFHLLNSSEVFNCKSVESGESLVAPAIDKSSTRCLLQKQPLLYSCAGHDPDYKRVCPCILYRKGQIALCKSCL